MNNSFPPGVVMLTSDRSVDFALSEGDDGLNVKQQEYLLVRSGVPAEKVFTVRQVHGNRVLAISARNIPQSGPWPEADGLVTKTPGIALTIRTADCLPVFIFDPKQKCIGLVHAGWRGASQHIVKNCLKAMQDNWGCHAADLLVAFGPAIRSCCYEVGEEFLDIFPHEVTKKKGVFHLDLPLVNKKQLLESGVAGSKIFDSLKCTVCNDRFFSYRREGQSAGRHLSLLMLRP